MKMACIRYFGLNGKRLTEFNMSFEEREDLSFLPMDSFIIDFQTAKFGGTYLFERLQRNV